MNEQKTEDKRSSTEKLADLAVNHFFRTSFIQKTCERVIDERLVTLVNRTVPFDQKQPYLLREVVTPELIKELVTEGYSHAQIATQLNAYFADLGMKTNFLKGSIHYYIQLRKIAYPGQKSRPEKAELLMGTDVFFDLEKRLKMFEPKKPEPCVEDRSIDGRAQKYVRENPRTRFRADQVATILRMRDEDCNGMEIARTLGCCYASVYVVLNKLGEKKKLRNPHFSTKEELAMVESVRTMGLAKAVKSNGHTSREYLVVLRKRAPDIVEQLYADLLEAGPKLRSAFYGRR